MPRFVILEHDQPSLHWDFMLEADDQLRTWRLPTPPQTGIPVAATPLGNHRIAYLDYEGPVRGNRGVVKRYDRGEYEIIEETQEHIVVLLFGERLAGRIILNLGKSPP